MTEAPAQFAVAWLETHGDRLYAYALARVGGDATVAEDLVQETLLAAIKAYPRFRGESSVETWLVGILRRKLVDWFRAKARRANREHGKPTEDVLLGDDGALLDIATWGADASRRMESEEFSRVFDACLAEIPPQQAEAFTLVVMDGLSIEETCSLLGVTPTNLSVRLHRARLALRKKLESRWFGGS